MFTWLLLSKTSAGAPNKLVYNNYQVNAGFW